MTNNHTNSESVAGETGNGPEDSQYQALVYGFDPSLQL